ncbi:MAG: hypothetical protein NTU89_00670, partial [Candidatus Dependentiae bacterium]|nr:hypothetical protein [Candidatus Dependentiae bacterium]
ALTTFALLAGGTTTTAEMQQITTGFGTAGYVLTSNGDSALPSFKINPAPLFINLQTSAYTVTSVDQLVLVDVSGGSLTISLPAAPAAGKVFTIKDTGSASVLKVITIDTVGGGGNIDGSSSRTIIVAYGAITVCFDGTSYNIINSYLV